MLMSSFPSFRVLLRDDCGKPKLSRHDELFAKKGLKNPVKKKAKPGASFCGFCKNNEESPEVYRGHVLKDEKGDVICPVLFTYVCPICKTTGKAAHTTRHCPMNPINIEHQRRVNEQLAALNDKSANEASDSKKLKKSDISELLKSEDSSKDLDREFKFLLQENVFLKTIVTNENTFKENLKSLLGLFCECTDNQDEYP